MRLAFATLRGVLPFGELRVDLRDSHGDPRTVTVVHGGAGVGKTTLLGALACTRPGQTTVASQLPSDDGPPRIACAWQLGVDEPDRPHPLLVKTPGTSTDDDDALRRREQVLFDRRAREQGGFVFLLFPANRWFSRQSVSLHAPARSMLRYDVRGTTALDQGNSADLTRETKQALAYAAISSALVTTDELRVDPRRLGSAMHQAIDAAVRLSGHSYDDLDPLSLEPRFSSPGGRRVPFDGLPTRTRHLVAIVAISIKTLWAAYPGMDPRKAEGVVAVDDIDLHQDPAAQAELLPTLRSVLTGVQWIVTTSSHHLAAAAAPDEVIALRRMSEDDQVSVFLDQQARTH